MVPVLYLLFFLSGAAALVYQVAWVRSLGLVFGGSHLAVTTVLSVFMGGLAFGSWLVGRRIDAHRRPLRLYGILELGIALSAGAFALLLEVYPSIYVPLARLAETNTLWLTTVRVALATSGLIVPTTLMGGTLPVLTRFVVREPGRLGGHLAVLYGLNTLGAVAGTLAAGFALLPGLGVRRTLLVAIVVNLAIGLVAVLASSRSAETTGEPSRNDRSPEPADSGAGGFDPSVARLVFAGIAISGFCALGYEVLWTRVLTMVVGTSVYSFTLILAAFLTGIAAGGYAQRWVPRRFSTSAFGAVQLLIGCTGLAVTYALRDLPAHAVRLQGLFVSSSGEFEARGLASFVVAFGFMAVPAFLMGLAFPLAGTVHAARTGSVGEAVGEVLTANTIGAILGAAVSGFVLVYAVGIERSLQVLAAANAGLGATVLAAAVFGRRGRAAAACATAATAVLIAALLAFPDWGRMWDEKLFAIWRNTQRDAFDTPERIRDARANTDVLYYFEGANDTISVVRPKGAQQAFIVNGRVEASTSAQDRQCQRTLGHLPMLAHPRPRKVFVLGTGTGMTLGATTLYPEVESIVLAEIEPGVLPATRTFARWNHGALGDSRLRIVFNDGRNFLRTTRERFDVITADPIHPWSGGASYLYTEEYFKLAAERLEPGGVICQWLPIYELTPEDLATVVRSFTAGFRHVMLWLTHYDAELLGSNEPIVFDREALERRIARSPVREDLEEVHMGSASDFLDYFVAGNDGLRRLAARGARNTDDNLRLEFDAPRSQGVARLMGDNVAALSEIREHVSEASTLYDRAHALFLWGKAGQPEFIAAFSELRERWPGYAPGRFLAEEVSDRAARQPRLIDRVAVALVRPGARPTTITISAVAMGIGPERGVVMFVDNDAREVYGERYVDAPEADLDRAMRAFAARVVRAVSDASGPGRPASPESLRETIAATTRP